jgi:hypothetical protein
MTIRSTPYIWHLIGTMPSTNTRITATIALMLGTGARVFWTGETPAAEWLGFLLISAGIDAGQFVGKRVTENTFVAAKNGVTTEMPIVPKAAP